VRSSITQTESVQWYIYLDYTIYKVGMDIFLKENKCPIHTHTASHFPKGRMRKKQRPSQTDYDNLAKWVQPKNIHI